MTFQQLTYVVEISKCGSINKAAHKLFLSQSGISTAVRELEEELGIQFFVRSNRGVEFTPEGKEFLSYAVSLLEQKNRLESLYSEARNTSAPDRFSVSTQRFPFTEDAFLRLLSHTEENRFNYSIKETGLDAVIDDVYDHRADIGVIFLTDLTEKIICHLLDSRKLEFYEIAAVPPCIYVRKDHPLTKQTVIKDTDLEGYPYVSFEHDQGVATDFSEEYQLVSLKKPSKCISVNNRTTIMNVLAQSDAFTTGSGLLGENIRNADIVSMPLDGKSSIRIGWIIPKNKKLSPHVVHFVDLLEQSVADSIRFTSSIHQALCHDQK